MDTLKLCTALVLFTLIIGKPLAGPNKKHLKEEKNNAKQYALTHNMEEEKIEEEKPCVGIYPRIYVITPNQKDKYRSIKDVSQEYYAVHSEKIDSKCQLRIQHSNIFTTKTACSIPIDQDSKNRVQKFSTDGVANRVKYFQYKFEKYSHPRSGA